MLRCGERENRSFAAVTKSRADNASSAGGQTRCNQSSCPAVTAPRAKNVVLVHGLFADGSSWSEVIPRLQAAGLNVTSVQNPLTTLPEAVDAALRVCWHETGRSDA